MKELEASPFPFTMQLDESTEAFQCAKLLAHVRYMHDEQLKNNFYFASPFLKLLKLQAYCKW